MNSSYSKEEFSLLIKKRARELGFFACGIAKAEPVDLEHAKHFQSWINSGKQAEMHYLNNYFDKRTNPSLLVPGTKSVISLALNYYPKRFLSEKEYQIAWYAYGKDYHITMKEKLTSLFDYINSIVPIQGRVFSDTAPVLERYWAWKAGLGWIGKNTQLILPKAGSSFFLGELFIDLELSYDTQQDERCGSCTKCLDACPTQALTEANKLDARRCLSYLTIENREAIPTEFVKSIQNKIYGCDECLKACPWTRYATPTEVEEFNLSEELLSMKREDWHQLSEKEYQELFRKTAIKRAKFSGLRRNIEAAQSND